MSRAGSAEDEVELWKSDNYIARTSNQATVDKETMLQGLKDKNLVYEEEIDRDNEIITIKKKDGTVVKEISYKDAELIKFFIGSIEYKAEKGMTWAEWCESEYNSLGVYEQYGDVFGEWGGYIATKDYSSGGHNGNYAVDPLDEIIAGFTYYCAPYAECVTPDSKILEGLSGKTTMAKYIKENDEIVYYDFNENTTKIGKVSKVYIHKNATNFVRYEFNDGTYLEATDYHPIYTEYGWKSLTRRNGYEVPQIGDKVKTSTGWKEIIKMESYTGLEDCYDFAITTKDGKIINNYYANDTLVQGSY